MATKTTKTIKLTPEQKAIKEVAKARQSFIITARAGSGKSTTIRDIVTKKGTVLCFGRKAADDMAAKLKNGATANTFHSTGKQMFPNGSVLKNGFIHWLIRDEVFGGNNPVKEGWTLMADLKLSLSWLQCQAFRPEEGLDKCKELLSDPRLDIQLSPDELVEHCIKLLFKIIDKTTWKGKSYYQYDLDGMQYLPFYHGWGKDVFDELYVDEAQDLNPIRWELTKLWMTDYVGVIGDPQQAIFQFQGSMSSALSLFQKELGAKELPLSVCWRCPSSHLDLARAIVPDIKDRPGAPIGEINNFDSIDDIEITDNGVMILSRVNADLIRMFYQLRKTAKRQVVIHSGDIIGKLKGLVGTEYEAKNKINHTWIDKFETKMDRKIQYAKSESSKGVLQDNKEQILIMISEDKPETVGHFHEIIENNFKMPDRINKDAIQLSTAHGAKGLEHPHIVINGRSNFPHPMAKLDWEKEAESNLLYVALTRSMDRLDIIPEA